MSQQLTISSLFSAFALVLLVLVARVDAYGEQQVQASTPTSSPIQAVMDLG